MPHPTLVNTHLLQGREFQFWEYFVSHGMLLIRSPNTPTVSGIVDIIFGDVDYVSLPRFLLEIEFGNATPDEIKHLSDKLRTPIVSPDDVWVLQNKYSRFFIVARALSIQLHHGSMFEPPKYLDYAFSGGKNWKLQP